MAVREGSLLVAHCDWSANPAKRWVATGRVGGESLVWAPERVGDAGTLIERLRGRASGAVLFVGFDFPIGLPRWYAQRAGVDAFPDFLRSLADASSAEFFEIADSPGGISVDRPFYPSMAAGSRQQHQLDALGAAAMDDLRRLCELASEERRAAAPLFWLVGAAQVGRAAIAGWRDVLIPALGGDAQVGMWPFDGELAELLGSREVVIAETYPTEFYGHLDAHPGRGGKRQRSAREPACAALMRAADALGVRVTDDAGAALESGFGDKPDGEDRFDAFVGLLGMINVVIGRRQAGPPTTVPPDVAAVEGWILGQAGHSVPLAPESTLQRLASLIAPGSSTSSWGQRPPGTTVSSARDPLPGRR